MCVIIVKQKVSVISENIVEASAKINPHGLGIVWLDTYEVEYYESKEYKILLTERPFIAHFRYATIGAVNKSNMHPFVCGQSKNELLMMNGTVAGYGNAKMTDSKELAIELGTINRRDWKNHLKVMDVNAPNFCRFVSINTKTKSFQVYNRELFTYRDGVWYSKSNVLQENVVAVYGTLKKGYNNYSNYLTKSRYVGKGETIDKYPLVIEGLPYLVNRKGIGHNVNVDVFKVSDQVLDRLDQLEGHPQWYRREKIDIELADGSTISCWVYFNPMPLDHHTKLHKSYKQERPRIRKSYNNYGSGWSRPTYTRPTYTKPQPTLDLFDISDDEQAAFESFVDDNDFPVVETPTCVHCYNDVEYDGFSDYHCSSCGSWFKEDDVLKQA